jgi:hypothetical protein
MKTIVGSFDSFDEANQVARELMDDGFRDSDVNVVASNVRGQYASGTGTSSGARAGAAIDTSTGVAGAGNLLGPGAATRSTGFTNVTGTAAMPGSDTTAGEHYTRAATDNAVTEDGAGLVDRAGDRDSAVDDASGAATGAVTGGVVGGAAGLAASLMGLAIPGIGPIIAAGPIVSTLTGVGVGAVAGGLIGGLTDMGVSRPDAEYYAEAVRRGGALVTVRAEDSRAERAAEVMRAHGAIDIERRAGQWRDRGWTGFDEKAQPYAPEDVDRDRDLYGETARITGIAEGASTGGPRESIPDRGTGGSTTR